MHQKALVRRQSTVCFTLLLAEIYVTKPERQQDSKSLYLLLRHIKQPQLISLFARATSNISSYGHLAAGLRAISI
jgi:hypothetical protein